MMGEVVSDLLDNYANEGVKREHWDLEGLRIALEKQFGIEVAIPEKVNTETLVELVKTEVQKKYDEQSRIMGEIKEDIERSLLLGAIDHYWKEHLYRVDRIRESVNLKAYAQKDPLLEYRKDTLEAFEEMNANVRADVVEKFMKLKVVIEQKNADGTPVDTEEVEEEREQILDSLRPKGPQKMTMSTGNMPANDGAPPGVSREQRRSMEKKAKKKKLF
jgi:preprotein translocase subunit SecA